MGQLLRLLGGGSSAYRVPPVSDFFDAALRIRASYDAKYTLSTSSTPTITAGAVGAVSTISGTTGTTTNIDSVGNGYSAPVGVGKNWILRNRSGDGTYSQGASKLFRFTGSKFDIRITNYGADLGPDVTVRYKEGGNWIQGPTLAKNVGTWASVGSRFILVDFGTTATRDIELVFGELPQSSGMNFSADGTLSATTERANDIRVMMFADSYVFGQGASSAINTMARKMGQYLGVLDCYNHGVRAKGWYEDPFGTSPHYYERIEDTVFPEITQWGPLDLVCINGTINDGGVAKSDLKPVVVRGLRSLRARQPNALIVFTAHMHSPDTRIGSAQQAAYTEAFDEVLGNDQGAILLDAVTENWIPVGAVGSSIYFPSSGDTVHPNDAGHLYFGEKIGAGALALADAIIAQIPVSGLWELEGSTDLWELEGSADLWELE